MKKSGSKFKISSKDSSGKTNKNQIKASVAKLINIEYGNLVHTDKIVAVVTPDSAPAKRLAQRAKQEERIVDATQGRKTRSVLIMDQNMVVLSALAPDTLAGRFHELVGNGKGD